MSYHVIGKKTIRKDGVAKVTGREKYASDIYLPNMLYARVLKSPYPHARVKSIDTSEAEKIGAVVITFKDVPDILFCPRLVSTPEATYKDWRVLTDKPSYVGEPIAAVAAETEEIAQKAIELIKVEYEVFEPSFDPLESMKDGKPKIHEKIILNDKEVIIENNIACKLELQEGDLEEAFKNSDVIIEREFKTNRGYHNQLEPKTAIVNPEPDGGLTIWCTTQSIHNTRLLISEIFKIPISKINVKKVALGGGFGSSIQTNIVVPIAVALALKARRPVRLAYTKEEDMHEHSSYQMIFKFKIGAKKDGRLTGGYMINIMDIGAHQIQAYPLLGTCAGWWVSLYKLQAMKYSGIAVYTNKVPSCAYRGYGNPQVTWAVETIMDELAEILGIDPIEIRLINYIGEGDLFWGQGPTVKSVIKSCGVEEILKKGALLIGWKDRPRPRDQKGRFRRGIGMARGYHTSSAGAPISSQVIDYSGAILKVNEDGTIDYITAMVDHGGGTLEAHAKIIAEEIGVPLKNVNIVSADTQTTVYDVCTHASRGIYAGGGAALNAARQVKKKILELASRILDAYPHSLKIRPDEERGQGIVYVEGSSRKEITIGELATLARIKNWGTIAAVESYRPPACPPHFTGYFVEVLVDTETGMVKPLKVVIGADVGTLINPDLAEGQLHGGFMMGWSRAILENLNYSKDLGDMECKGFIIDYKMPTVMDIPDEIKTFFVETYEPTGPFGAKGLGEGAQNPAIAAIANAIYNAIGIRFYELPITPEKILEKLKQSKEIEKLDLEKEVVKSEVA
ncbi:MAG: xanthine dehydrogenase family protein molybdopterin-binding subunit [Aigarchaeota archaeon]|nr:xanthine dehydrogenase family protein molybdopterin-binding subunit [Aigarchaeota archaeon]MCX8193149.1 xanthine dehydrogenase family protein molybdopterin-binding subunit [Nitrososphaeria archaeon]MDW7986772.1 xanthine dehydrogenase family protein molybdopterin-binding subunit [Nitrososphaerota archaeon]